MASSRPPYDEGAFHVSFPQQWIAHVELNRPNKLNAFSNDMWDSMQKVFRQLGRDADVRCVLISGRGDKAFTAGLDVSGASSDGPLSENAKKDYPDPARHANHLRRHILDLQESINVIEKCEKPVIAVVHGYSFGAAIDISSACDVRICAADTKFCVKETNIGLAADLGTLTRLPKLGVSLSFVKELAYTARVFTAEEALRFGFVSHVAATKAAAIEHAMGIAKQIVENSPVAVVGTKKTIDFSRDHPIADGLDFIAAWNQGMLQTEDVPKAMMSGLKRTKPKFAKL